MLFNFSVSSNQTGEEINKGHFIEVRELIQIIDQYLYNSPKGSYTIAVNSVSEEDEKLNEIKNKLKLVAQRG